MQLELADAGPLAKKLTISYSPEEVRVQRAKVLRQLSGEVKLNGFRPGKTSNAVVEKRYGAAATARVEEMLADEGLNQAVKNHSLKPMGPIQSDEVARADGLRLVLSFEVKPTIVLPEPASLGVVDEKVELPETDVDQAIETLCKRAGDLADLPEGATIIEDDSITLQGNITINGSSVREVKDLHHLVGGYPLFGTSTKDVTQALAGKKAGDTIVLDTTLPGTFVPAEHANKAARLELNISKAQRLIAAKADDDFARRMGMESMEKLREGMRTRLTTTREQSVRQKQVQQVTDLLLEKVHVELPPKFLESNLARSIEQALAKAKGEGKTGADLDKIRSDTTEQNMRQLRRFLIIDAISDSRKVAVTREDLEDQIRMAAIQTGRKPEEIAKQLDSSGQIRQVVHEIRESKAIEIYLDEALGRPAIAPGIEHGQPGHVHGPDCNH